MDTVTILGMMMVLYLHRGYDITSRSGDRTVYSMGAGEVAEIDNNQHYYVRVEMTDGHYINYVHIETTNLEIGDEVKANDVIGFYGEVGRTTPGYPHLHIQFESPIYQAVNPASYWPGGEPPYWRFGAPAESQ